MLEVIRSGAVLGLDAYQVAIEVDVSRGLPGITVVGLPDAAVQESRERVKTAIVNCGYELKPRRITVNLAPADIRKEGPLFDLPIAVGVILATKQGGAQTDANGYWLIGELSLTGEVKAVKGILAIAVEAARIGQKGIIVPQKNAREAAFVDGIDVFPVKSLGETIQFLAGNLNIEPVKPNKPDITNPTQDIDFADVKGQIQARRALEIAAAGGHNILMIGPPGAGKSMLATRLPTIMPSLALEEAIEVTKIYSVRGLMTGGKSLIRKRPFRAPHHTISSVGLVGGGQNPRPGEITLSHRGVLFLDEMPEFSKSVLQVLRQPLEAGKVTISRASGTITYPAEFMLVGAMNPCPCGYLGDSKRECVCTNAKIRSYRSRLSGPLLDRIDIQIEVPSLTRSELQNTSATESSKSLRKRVMKARKIQGRRFCGESYLNGRMSTRQTKNFCPISTETKEWLGSAAERLSMSARAFERVFKISRTIADLAGRENISLGDVTEAVQYRLFDRQNSFYHGG